MTDLLNYLPESNPNRARILQEYRKMMATLKSYRNEEGLWNQLIDDPDVWTETSGSAMFTYAMIIGVKKGWLDAEEYAPVVRQAWLALLTYLDEGAALRNVCEGTNVGTTKQYYIDRRRNTGDLHGQAALLWHATGMLKTPGLSLYWSRITQRLKRKNRKPMSQRCPPGCLKIAIHTSQVQLLPCAINERMISAARSSDVMVTPPMPVVMVWAT